MLCFTQRIKNKHRKLMDISKYFAMDSRKLMDIENGGQHINLKWEDILNIT